MKLTCVCCGHTAEFEDGEAAFKAGWDAPPHFIIITCDLCPAAPVAIQGVEGARERHAALHEKWKKEGRPKDFDVAAELEIDGVSRETFDRFVEDFRQLVEAARK